MSGKTSQRKGRSGELELTMILNDNGIPAEVGEPVSYGSTPDITGVSNIHVECKRVERLNIYQAISQAEVDSKKFQDGAPTVFHRRNRKPWLVTMRLTDWIRLYKSDQER